MKRPLLAAAVLLTLVGCAAPTPTLPPVTPPAPTTTNRPAVAPASASPTFTRPTTSQPPALTVSQANALEQAESYLDYTAFSRTGLIDQLEYEGYSTADATYAVDHVAVDWMQQAALKAQSYLDYSSFSRKGLIDQLEYEGFTTEQARYGVDSVGL